MQPKFYDIRFHASHLDKIMNLVETQTIGEWKQIWLSVNHQVAQQNKKEAELANEKPSLSVVEGTTLTEATAKVEAAE
jgi:hypothetical protein